MLKLLPGFLAVLLVVYALGPRAGSEIVMSPVALPVDLDEFLSESEGRFSDIRRDADKRIVWANPADRAQTFYSVVDIHGFSATRMETSPFAELIAKDLGANLFLTRLAGHGRSDDAMGDATLSAWMNDMVEACAIGHRLGQHVVVIGTSTGGTLATLLATRPEGKDLHALVLISPNFRLRQWNAPAILWPWGEQIARLVVGDYRSWQASNPRQSQHWTMRYPVRALIPLMQSVAMLDALDLGGLQTPTLIFYARGDRVVDSRVLERRFDDIAAAKKKLVAVDSAEDPEQHILVGDILSPGQTRRLADVVVHFVRS